MMISMNLRVSSNELKFKNEPWNYREIPECDPEKFELIRSFYRFIV